MAAHGACTSNDVSTRTPALLNEEQIFQIAASLPAAERTAYLHTACEGQPALRQRVEQLLASHEDDGFMQRGADRNDSTELQAELARLKPEEGAGSVIGRYKLLEKLGEGGFGSVWAAEQREPVKRRVALKIIKLGMDTKQVVARFEAERQALAMMDHPNIAKVLDAGSTDNGRPYFVMELVKGIPITKYCDHEKLGTKDRLDLFIKVCQAIQHAHQKGIIHRDIKPSNIMVTLHDGVPVPKVIDFGIAKATQQELTELTIYTQHHQFIGTPAYMSPEQAEMSGLDIDTRSDIYSLGVLLYELLTGKTPFDAKELMKSGIDAMRRIIREQEPVRPSTRLSQTLVAADKVGRVAPRAPSGGESMSTSGAHGSPLGGTTVTRPTTQSEEEVRASSRRLLQELRGDLDWIVMKCLDKDRKRRYETANGLAADLNRHLTNEPVLARPPSAAYKFQKAFRRNKLAFTAATAVAAALVIGIGISTWQATVATRARNDTEQARVAENAQRLAAQEESKKARTAEAEAVAERTRSQHQLYVANMNAVQHRWEQNHVSRARELLKETATSPERGFEWYYWQRQMHRELKVFRGHTGPVLAVAYSPDGQRIVTGSADNTAKVWGADTDQEPMPLVGHNAPVRSVVFSPDGQRIVTGSWDGTAIVWDANSGRNLFPLEGHKGFIFSVAFSKDGQRIVTGSQDKTAKVWDAATGTNLLTFSGHSNFVWAVAFSPDGQRVVSGGWDRAARVWDAANGNELRTLVGHRGAVLSVAFSPDGQRIVTGSQDNQAIVWNATNGAVLYWLRGHGASVFSVGFSRDGKQIVSGSGDQTARLWDASSGEQLRVFKGPGSQIGSVALSPDGRWIVTGGGAVRFRPDGQTVNVSIAEDPTAKVWDANGGMEVLTLEGHTDAVTSVDISADGRLILSGSFDGTARVWDVRSGRRVQKVSGTGAVIRAVAFLPDGKRFVTGSFDSTASIWDIASGRELHKLKGHTDNIFSLAVSPDGRWIATGSWDQTVRVWDAATGRHAHTFSEHGSIVFPVAFSPDSRRIVSADFFGFGKVWEASSGKELLRFRDTAHIWSAAFSDDGRRIVTGNQTSTATVWDAASGEYQLILKGHTAHIHAAVFSPDGRRIVTGSVDQTAKLWDATTGKELLTLEGHSGPILSVAFSKDGQRIVTGSGDGTIKVWEAASAEQVKIWSKEEETSAAPTEAEVRKKIRNRALGASDPGISQWLVLAPIAIEGTGGAAALDQEQVPQEARLRPRAGERVKIGGHEAIWSAVRPKDHWLEFNLLVGKVTPDAVAYAVCYLQSDTHQRGLVMKIGSDDQAKIFLNEREIYRQTEPTSWGPDRDEVSGVELQAGLNVLVFKIVNEQAGWGGSVRFTDRAGQPVSGLRVTLAPDELVPP